MHASAPELADVLGPLAVGMRSILFTGVVDRGSERTRAQAVCRHFIDLPTIVRQIR